MRLQQGIKDYETKAGMRGRLEMALAAGVGERMIRRFKNGESLPTSDQAHSIAKCWGASDDEAFSIAKEFSSSLQSEVGGRDSTDASSSTDEPAVSNPGRLT